jgi:plastocyanin
MKSFLFVAVSLIFVGVSSLDRVSVENQGGVIAGTVSYYETDQPPEIIPNTIDPMVCGEEIRVQAVHVDEGTRGLQNVVVSIQSAPSHSTVVPTKEVIVQNTECLFLPRVDAAQLGQRVEVQNQDPILHNTHISLGKRTILNVAQLPRSRPIHKPLKRQGLYTIRCDKHKFMAGALQVFDHPYFAITDATGKFQLPPLSAGTYIVDAWHETLGSLTQEVTVPVDGTVAVQFAYR